MKTRDKMVQRAEHNLAAAEQLLEDTFAGRCVAVRWAFEDKWTPQATARVEVARRIEAVAAVAVDQARQWLALLK